MRAEPDCILRARWTFSIYKYKCRLVCYAVGLQPKGIDMQRLLV